MRTPPIRFGRHANICSAPRDPTTQVRPQRSRSCPETRAPDRALWQEPAHRGRGRRPPRVPLLPAGVSSQRRGARPGRPDARFLRTAQGPSALREGVGQHRHRRHPHRLSLLLADRHLGGRAGLGQAPEGRVEGVREQEQAVRPAPPAASVQRNAGIGLLRSLAGRVDSDAQGQGRNRRRVPHQALRVNEDRHPDAREALRGPRHPDATRTGRDDTGARPGRMVGCADRLPEEPARRTASRHEGRHPEGRLHCEAAQPARRSSPDRSRQQLHGPAPPRPAHLPVRGSERRAPGRFRGRVAVPLRWRGASRW
jgi:hypothetical protein